MAKDPDSRIGIKDKELIKLHPFFDGVDWGKVLQKEYAPPQLVEGEEEHFEMDKGLVRKLKFLKSIFFQTKRHSSSIMIMMITIWM